MSRNSKKMETLPLPTLLSTPLKCCRRFSSEDEDLEQALRNYERYHKLPVGTATLAQLKSSSAGVSGWVDYHGSDDGNGSSKTEDDGNDNDDKECIIFHTLNHRSVVLKLQDIYPVPMFLKKLKEIEGDDEVKKKIYKVISDIENMFTIMVNYIKELMFSRPDVHLYLQKASSLFNEIMNLFLKQEQDVKLFSNVLLYCMQIYAKKGADKKYKQDFELFYRLREPYGDFFHELDLLYRVNGIDNNFEDEIYDHIKDFTVSELDYNVGVHAFIIPLINGYIFRQIYMLQDFVIDLNVEGNGPYFSITQRLDKLLSGNFILEEFLLLPAPFNTLSSMSKTFSPNKFVLNLLGHYLGYLTGIAEEAEEGTKTNPFFTIQHYGGGLNKNCRCNDVFLSCCSVFENEKAVIDIISHLHFLNITEICNLKHLEKCADEYLFKGFKDSLKVEMNKAINFFLKVKDYPEDGLLLLNLYHILHGAYHNNDVNFRRRVDENFCTHPKVLSRESRFALIKQSKPFDNFDEMVKRVREVNYTYSFKTLQYLMNVKMNHAMLNACQLMRSFVIQFIPETNNRNFIGVYDVNKFPTIFCLDYRSNGLEYTSVKQEPIDFKGDGIKYVYMKDMLLASRKVNGVSWVTFNKHFKSFLTSSLRKTLDNDNVTIASTCRVIKVGKRQKWLVSVGVVSNQEHNVDITINDGKDILHFNIKTTDVSMCCLQLIAGVEDSEQMVIFYPYKSSKLYLVEDKSEINLFVGGNNIFDVTPNGLHVSLYLVRITEIFQIIYSFNISFVLKDKLKEIEALMEDEKEETEKIEMENDVEREWDELKKAYRANGGILKKNGLYPMKYNDSREELKRVLFSNKNREDAEACYTHLTTFYHPSLYDEEKYRGKKKICHKKDGTYVSSCKLPQGEKKPCCRYVSIMNELFHRDNTVVKCKAVQPEKKINNVQINDVEYDNLLKEMLTKSKMGKYRDIVDKINHAIQFYQGPINETTFPSLSSLNLSEIPMLNLKGKTLRDVMNMPEDMSGGPKLFYTLCVNNTPLFRKIKMSCIREEKYNVKSFLPLHLLHRRVSDFDSVFRLKIKNKLVIKEDMPSFDSFVKGE